MLTGHFKNFKIKIDGFSPHSLCYSVGLRPTENYYYTDWIPVKEPRRRS